MTLLQSFITAVALLIGLPILWLILKVMFDMLAFLTEVILDTLLKAFNEILRVVFKVYSEERQQQIRIVVFLVFLAFTVTTLIIYACSGPVEQKPEPPKEINYYN